MIKIFVENQELDLFEDESITLNRSIKNLTDISTVFTTFSQGFTVPASRTNNRIFQHWYRDDLLTGFTGLKRLDAFITLNGQVIERGGVKLEGASIENGIPKDYKLGFFGNTSKLKETVGNDTLQNLDFSAYNHLYDAVTIIDGFGSDTVGSFTGLSGGALIYPLFSPVRNWQYDSSASSTTNNIAFVDDGTVNGVYYYEPKPALQVTKILDAIESEYDVTFSGSFLSSSPFNQLYLWLHNREGYTFEGQDEAQFDMANAINVVNVNHTNSTGGAIYGVGSNLTYVVQAPVVQGGSGFFTFDYEFSTLSGNCFLALTANGVLIDSVYCTATSTNYTLGGNGITNPYLYSTGTVFRVQVVKLTTSLTYQIQGTVTTTVQRGATGGSGVAVTSSMASSSSIAGTVVVSNLMPDISITDFLNGLIKQYNLIVTSEDGSTFNFETYDSYYGSGQEVDISRWLDTRSVEVESVPKYGDLSFTYEESDQVLHKQFRAGTGRNYGDLIQRLNFDSETRLDVKVPFELPFTEKLTDLNTGTSFTDFTCYKSIEVDQDGSGSSYLGAPVLFYYSGNLDISSTSISWVDESDTETEIVEIPFCEAVNSETASTAEGLTFGQDINPYLEDVPNDSLYSAYWSNFISQTYDTRTRIYKLKAFLNLGTYVTLELNDLVIWKGRKYIINSMSTNFKTGETELELITKV